MNLYYVFNGNFGECCGLFELRRHLNKLWSARLSTGLFGLPDCKPGNIGPKDFNEVILGLGYNGLRELVRMGFLPCPSCKPENRDDKEKFWGNIEEAVKGRWGKQIDSLEKFCDKKILGYDARKVDWEKIIEITKIPPSRIYLPKGLEKEEIIQLKKRFLALRIWMPEAGYYDANADGCFVRYDVSAGN